MSALKRPNFDLVIVAAVTLVTMLLALTQIDLGIIRALLAVLFVCVLPGYAIMAAAFPQRPLNVETVVYTLGISLSVAVLVGLLLNYTATGLTTVAWAILLGTITLSASLIALLNRRQVALPNLAQSIPQFSRRSLIIFGITALLLIVAFRFTSIGAESHAMGQFTQLWMTPAEQQQANVGIRNHESTAVGYKLRVVVGDTVIQEWPSITLDPDSEWTGQLTLPTGTTGGNSTQMVEAQLYRLDAPDIVYRHVSLSR
jgi:uncharacterized membrane protein